ncbi:MAG: hypothetical protein JETCAE01_05490 [Anaerolineaceae bacterium]|nr:MAG: hypothetical protein JETCAE01_05490 [Anaerolineaceae bacterium]
MREEVTGGDEGGGGAFTVSVEGGDVNVAGGGEVNVIVGIGDEVKVGIGVLVCAAGWNGVADSERSYVGRMNSAKGRGVDVGVAGAAQAGRKEERRKKKVMRNVLFVMRKFFFIDRRCGSIG